MRFVKLFAILASAHAALFASFVDSECTIAIAPIHAYTDTCTWTTNHMGGSNAISLEACSSDELMVRAYSFSNPICNGDPDLIFNVTTECTAVENFYVKLLDPSHCEGQNNTFNFALHGEPGCTDPAWYFSINTDEDTCNGYSFAPMLLGFDTSFSSSPLTYTMNLYSSTNGTCRNLIGIYGTNTIPAKCLSGLNSTMNEAYLDVYFAAAI